MTSSAIHLYDVLERTSNAGHERQEMNDECFRVVEKALCANENGVLVVDSLWLTGTAKTVGAMDWHRRAGTMNELALLPWNLPLLDPTVPVSAKVVVFPLHGDHHWSALVWYRHHEGSADHVTLHHYDSVPNLHSEMAAFLLREWLSDHRQLFFSASRTTPGTANIVRAEHYLVQSDAYACGYHVATLIDILVQRTRLGVFSPIEPDNNDLTNSAYFHARKHRVMIDISKRLKLLLPRFPASGDLDGGAVRSILGDRDRLRHVYVDILHLSPDDVDHLADTRREWLLPVLATYRDIDIVDDDDDDDDNVDSGGDNHGHNATTTTTELYDQRCLALGLGIRRDEFASYWVVQNGFHTDEQQQQRRQPLSTKKSITILYNAYKRGLQRRHEELLLFAVEPRVAIGSKEPQHYNVSPWTFGYGYGMDDPETLWRYCSLAVDLVHRVRLWAHELWIDQFHVWPRMRASLLLATADVPVGADVTPAALVAAQRRHNVSLLKDALERFGYYYSESAGAACLISNRARFVDGMRRVLSQCEAWRLDNIAPAFSDFFSWITCLFVCRECVAVAPVRVRCSSQTFGPRWQTGDDDNDFTSSSSSSSFIAVASAASDTTPGSDPRLFHDECLGLAMLWRGAVAMSTASSHHRFEGVVAINHSSAPRSHSAQATIWRAFRLDDRSTPYGHDCSGQSSGTQHTCFARFVTSDAPPTHMTWAALVASGLRAFYEPVLCNTVAIIH